MKSFNRYSDINKFVTDPNELKIVDNSYVYISREEDYGIALDLDERVSEFEMLKSQIVFMAEHICELDNMAQKFIYMRHPEETEFMENTWVRWCVSKEKDRGKYTGKKEIREVSNG